MNFRLELLRSTHLKDFPSASSIQFYKDRLYLVGDDANFIQILDKNYDSCGRITLFHYPEKRIPKAEKLDLEASVVITKDGLDYLIAFGSGATEKRMILLSVPLQPGKDAKGLPAYTSHNVNLFLNRLPLLGINKINLEGATLAGNKLVFSNRNNRTRVKNHLVITDPFFWLNQNEAEIHLVELSLPPQQNCLPGISELHYVVQKDLLLFTASSEATTNAYDDGDITDSYLGGIEKFSKKMGEDLITVNQWVNLAELNEAFNKEKIEGVCVESEDGDEFVIHLISDNDDGESNIFNLKMLLTD